MQDVISSSQKDKRKKPIVLLMACFGITMLKPWVLREAYDPWDSLGITLSSWITLRIALSTLITLRIALSPLITHRIALSPLITLRITLFYVFLGIVLTP